MMNKVVTWFGNLVLACVLVFFAIQPPAMAQETDVEVSEEELDVAEEEINTDPNRTESIALSGTAVIQTVGGLRISPTQFDTGLLDIGQSTEHQVEITHAGAVGTDPVQIGEASVFGGAAAEFVSDFGGFVTLNPGDSIVVTLTYTPILHADISRRQKWWSQTRCYWCNSAAYFVDKRSGAISPDQ